jgi:hypothetical protein
VHEHTGLNFFEIEQLPIDEYLLYRRDAYIYALQQSEEGRNYLDECYRFTQTEPDKENLREKFGK